MTANCPRSPSHEVFMRKVEVIGITHEIVDVKLQHVALQDPQEQRLLRRFTGVWCATCKTQAHITIP